MNCNYKFKKGPVNYNALNSLQVLKTDVRVKKNCDLSFQLRVTKESVTYGQTDLQMEVLKVYFLKKSTSAFVLGLKNYTLYLHTI